MGPKIKSLVDRVMMRSKICPKICVDTVTCCFQQLVESYSIIAMHQIHVKLKSLAITRDTTKTHQKIQIWRSWEGSKQQQCGCSLQNPI